MSDGMTGPEKAASTDAATAAADAIAVFTSGGDAPGMNAVVRAVARMGQYYNRKVFAIYEGYQGLVDGGDLIRELEWQQTSMIIHQGGTVIGSARCAEFRERAGRLRACKNLVSRGITNLVCCGGDGSLTGANIFKLEWPSLLEDLVASGDVSQEAATACSFLNLVGCVGSIDNDMVYEGTMTIGTDTALHRIVDAIDAVQSTASSHQRTFVLEIMGRHCGYLAWAAAVATGADYVFIPESPPKESQPWEESLCETLERRRKRGARLCTVLVAEGAVDRQGKPIKSERVREVIVERLKHDTRTTILGHVQRGGHASAYDRILGTISGAMAVEKICRSHPGDPSTIVGVEGFFPRFNPLKETIAATQMVGKHMDALDFASAIEARGHDFRRNFEILRTINRDVAKFDVGSMGKNVAIVCSGAPAAGMNAAIRAACHYAMNFGYTVYAVQDGFKGFCSGDVRKLGWMEVSTWSSEGGCNIRTDRGSVAEAKEIAACVKANNLHAICVIGGFDALRTIDNIKDELPVPVAFLPATISNNVPGTDYSVGSDTAINAITSAIDTCKKSADSSSNRVFILETQGRNCGYLALMACLASGADVVYTREEGVTLGRMQADIQRIKDQVANKSKRHFVIVRNEYCSPSYDLNFMETLFAEEGRGLFSVRTVKLGHLCQGDYPSPLDRVRASLFASLAMRYLIESIKNGSTDKVVVSDINSRVGVKPIASAIANASWDKRMPETVAWSWAMPLQRVLSGEAPREHLQAEYSALIAQLCQPNTSTASL